MSPRSVDDPMGQDARIPTATYRIQFNSGFTFRQAAELVPYLALLGVSHCYASPYLRARTGSEHGYDIVDHNALQPELGDWRDYRAFTDALAAHGMGQILDLVPNHMGVGGNDNVWWLDVLENGEASPFASYFDIDWHPVKERLRGKVLVPLLGDHYGAVLEDGQLSLTFDEQAGAFSVQYYEHRFPIDPSTYGDILGAGLDRLRHRLGDDSLELAEYQSLITAFQNLPARSDTASERRSERNRDKELLKRRLAELCSRATAVAEFLRNTVAWFNGTVGQPSTFDPLHRLLERQAYRLSYWKVAADEINYRRFFDINDLAGLRMDNPEVFEATHALVLELIATGSLDGLRIDHPDGLYDPLGYYRRLQSAITNALDAEHGPAGTASVPRYVVVEKILASYERLPADWPVHGTTGYEYAALLNGLFVNPASERTLTRLYTRFIGRTLDFDDLLYERKRLIIQTTLSSELTVLANSLDAIAQSDRHTRDFTLNGLRDALIQVVACFPVYRTYVTTERVSEADVRYVDWAISQAEKRMPAADVSILAFIRSILLVDRTAPHSSELLARVVQFAMKFQQYTAPAMAKGLEDTALYVYNRLVSVNEVGDDPRHLGTSVGAFHHANQERLQNWPHAMLATSTHDAKRSEDVRARINVLSEVSEQWRVHLSRWSRVNRSKKRIVDGQPAPSRNDEYLLYQTLIGAWPLEPLDEQGLDTFRERIEAYMLKAAREAKVDTSWINPNTEYEEAITDFVRRLFGTNGRTPFLADFLPFQARVARFGLLNSLSQTLLKLLSPGVPDLYQGTELWTFSLVDPDNRRAVDFQHRRALLEELVRRSARESLQQLTRELCDTLHDGRAKLYLAWRALGLRRDDPELFQLGDYLPLATDGPCAAHLCAFARRRKGREIVAIAPRWFATLGHGDGSPDAFMPTLPDTTVELPSAGPFTDALTGRTVEPTEGNGHYRVQADRVLAEFPVALLMRS
ncbi:MAG: malto-oligosyltrehalose synthase [Gammaproteobacteria bacterium]